MPPGLDSGALMLTLKSIKHCARCDGDHENLEAKPFERPVLNYNDGSTMYTHWVACPTNGDPILVVMVDDDGT